MAGYTGYCSDSGFKANCLLSIRSEEVKNFLIDTRALYESLKGEAKFLTMEEGVEINLKAGRGGLIELKSRIQYPIGCGETLKFNFEIDQTYLPSVIQQIEEVVSRFPVLGKP